MRPTSKELEEISGLTRQTIQDYVKKGWVPEPKFQSNGRHGATLLWPSSTITRLALIETLKKSGHKNRDISRILKGEKTE